MSRKNCFNSASPYTEADTTLFSTKDMYIMGHTEDGKLRWIDELPPKQKLKKMHENMHLMESIPFDSKGRFPQLKPYTGSVDFELVAYSDRKKHNGKNQALHFFLDDYKFRNPVWYGLEKTTFSIRNYDYYFTPDLSLWVDLPTDFCNIENIYRTRFVGAYWQICGYQVIPTASWGNRDSFSYCFEGLPERSILAVCGTGHCHCSAAKRLFYIALRELEIRKHPILILIYGEEEYIPGLSTPVKFLPCFIKKRFRNG